MSKSNHIIQYLVKTDKIKKPAGLPHFGGKQYTYNSDDSGLWDGNINIEKLGEAIYDMNNEDIKEMFNYIRSQSSIEKYNL